MQRESIPFFWHQLSQRFHSLVWSCLDADLTKTAVFYAERYFAANQHTHDSRHLYATALLKDGVPYSALNLVDNPTSEQCSGCFEIKSKCLAALKRYKDSRLALQSALEDPSYIPIASSSTRTSRYFPDEALLRCRSGVMAAKANQPELAANYFREALTLNPMLWEAFEGLCALGEAPEVDDIFPPRQPPILKIHTDESQARGGPIATGAGFFTPETGNGGSIFRTWKPDTTHPQSFRIPPPSDPRDSIATNDMSFYPDNSFQQFQRTTRTQSSNLAPPPQPHISRPLSSADEGGPVTKRQRSTVRPPEALKTSKPSQPTAAADDSLKKARARPALIFANIFSSSGRRSQPTTSSRTTGLGKSNAAPKPSGVPTRRSTRLLSGATSKQPATQKQPSTRKRQPTHGSRSAESEMEEDPATATTSEVAYSQSPPSVAHTPRSEISPSPTNRNAMQDQAALQEHATELADYYIYNIMRQFAAATRALAKFECQKCLDVLELLPHPHQHTTTVLAMVGRAHYEKQDFASAERAFKAVRALDPYRSADMEVYSTLLWHLQQSVDLAFLAQELLNINPRSPQAWIAVGNTFSLQKDRSQALTCFGRATQLDPMCAYAYTLSGHESIDDDLDKAIAFFQKALRSDRRHYNAWYGLGTCYLRMNKIRLAEYHYRAAVKLYPNNAVLLGCLGMTVERRGDKDHALSLFEKAVELAPDNALVRYRRAKIFISMKRYQLAARDLEYLRNTTPEESNVVFQLAKVYRLMGEETKSAQTLAVARDISPKSINKIKKLLETVKDEGGEDRMDEG